MMAPAPSAPSTPFLPGCAGSKCKICCSAVVTGRKALLSSVKSLAYIWPPVWMPESSSTANINSSLRVARKHFGLALLIEQQHLIIIYALAHFHAGRTDWHIRHAQPAHKWPLF